MSAINGVTGRFGFLKALMGTKVELKAAVVSINSVKGLKVGLRICWRIMLKGIRPSPLPKGWLILIVILCRFRSLITLDGRV